MAPKRTTDTGSSESPKKRVKKDASSSQQSIQSFFSKGKDPIRYQTPPSAAPKPQRALKLEAEVIVIDDSEEDEPSGRPDARDANPQAALSVRSALPVHTDVGIASFSTSEISVLPLLRSAQSVGPNGPTILNPVKHVTGAVTTPSIASNTSESLSYRSTRGHIYDTSSGPLPLDTSAILPFPDLTIDSLLFDPCVDADQPPWWPQKSGAPYAILVHALQALTSTRSRISILSILTNVLRVLIAHDPVSVLPALYLLSNSLSPAWEGIELGVGASIISKVCIFPPRNPQEQSSYKIYRRCKILPPSLQP